MVNKFRPIPIVINGYRTFHFASSDDQGPFTGVFIPKGVSADDFSLWIKSIHPFNKQPIDRIETLDTGEMPIIKIRY